MAETLVRHDVGVAGQREKFAGWIKDRKGVIVWVNQDLSNCGAGNIYTPATTQDGKDARAERPRWSHAYCETVTDIRRFRFLKADTEVARFRVSIRGGANGLNLKCTGASTRKIRAACAKAGPDSVYVFDYETQEAVILLPKWEE